MTDQPHSEQPPFDQPRPTEQSVDEFADAIFDAIERGDGEAIAALWADDIEVWHSNDNVVQNKEQNLAVLNWMTRRTASIEYRDIVRDVTARGFAQRHVLHLVFDDERTADLHVAVFVEVEGGRVTRIDEYIDSAHAAAAFAG